MFSSNDLRNLSNSFLYTLNMSDVIKIDNSTDLICIFKLFIRSVIRGKHNVSLHAFLASNTVTNDYYPMLAKVMFELAVKLQKETGAHIKFINLSGGIGIPYRPEQTPNDIRASSV